MDPETKRQIIAAIDNDMIIYPIVKDAFETAEIGRASCRERV